MKKVLLLLVLVIALGGIVSAKEAHKNVIYVGSTGLFGFASGYERMLSKNFSLLIDTGLAFLINPAVYISTHLRWFPFLDSQGKPIGFFLDAGTGLGRYFHWADSNDKNYDIMGIIFSSGLGFKFGSRKSKGLVFAPSLNYDIYLGEKSWDYNANNERESKFGAGFNTNLKLLFGFGF